MSEIPRKNIEISINDDALIGQFINKSEHIIIKLELIIKKINKKHKDIRISKIVGISTTAVGSVVSIVGIALVPITFGVSIGLAIGGGAGMIEFIKSNNFL
jgi:apolipoprotein L